MDVREKLVELIKDGIRKGLRAKGDDRLDYSFEDVADYLIANGVTVQECKLGVKKTNADRIRSMSDEELATHLHDIGWDCHLCAEHGRLDNEPLLRGKKCDEKCVEHCLEWLRKPAEEADNETVGERKDGYGNG